MLILSHLPLGPIASKRPRAQDPSIHCRSWRTDNRMSETRTSPENLAGERMKTEERARAFLGGEVLKTILERIHLAFNARFRRSNYSGMT